MTGCHIDAPTVTVTVEEAARDLDALVEKVMTTGMRVSIVRDGAPAAVIVSWEWYRAAQERLARHQLAYWTSWSADGVFDGAAYARMITDLPVPPAQVSPRDTGGDDA
ncbi:hypothetical protein DDP54_07780 [Cellulomonas sp. WB94]|uniref:type II toxin-antitoxin system Phd/YefM family antitoxin n=1 Tax=Cellulomonas sp. WB94 TaxID=2173174 RepID=UPI000D5722AE|nr:type II toxin-antitoxin system Phd/YefM family antitoxin [Cellulomonas sp. WB94]PVU82919.1 hypothetical protein DDP54_07780 [Cellulomonas sp. WB94]